MLAFAGTGLRTKCPAYLARVDCAVGRAPVKKASVGEGVIADTGLTVGVSSDSCCAEGFNFFQV
jgi:hypothetical protein